MSQQQPPGWGPPQGSPPPQGGYGPPPQGYGYGPPPPPQQQPQIIVQAGDNKGMNTLAWVLIVVIALPVVLGMASCVACTACAAAGAGANHRPVPTRR